MATFNYVQMHNHITAFDARAILLASATIGESVGASVMQLTTKNFPRIDADVSCEAISTARSSSISNISHCQSYL
jgi:hypothetical protein